jgi:hypothetical protein
VMELPLAGACSLFIVTSLRLTDFMLVSVLCPHYQFTSMSASVRTLSRGVNENA